MDRTITLNLQAVEIAAIRELINMAVMARGMGVAQAAVTLDQKLAAALQPPEPASDKQEDK